MYKKEITNGIYITHKKYRNSIYIKDKSIVTYLHYISYVHAGFTGDQMAYFGEPLVFKNVSFLFICLFSLSSLSIYSLFSISIFLFLFYKRIHLHIHLFFVIHFLWRQKARHFLATIAL